MTVRRWELDALRGLMLVLMTVTHIPTGFSAALGQPFGYVSAAEGFVFLSAFMAGMVYTGRRLRHGERAMCSAVWRRARDVYACHAGLVIFLLTVVVAIAIALDQHAVTNLVSYYLQFPVPAFAGALALMYQPPLLDILPMYVILLLVTPILLIGAARYGWSWFIALSAGLWVCAQLGLGAAIHDVFSAATGNPVPLRVGGSFSLLAWQFLWVAGLWLGARYATPESPPLRFPRWVTIAAAMIVVSAFLGRHLVGQTPFPDVPMLTALFNKWQLMPLRLLNFFALVALAIRFGPALCARLPRLHYLETLGRASLPVFCAHLVLALLFLALLGSDVVRPVPFDLALLGATLLLLYAVASTGRDTLASPKPAGVERGAPVSA